jgi:hypothetical protein
MLNTRGYAGQLPAHIPDGFLSKNIRNEEKAQDILDYTDDVMALLTVLYNHFLAEAELAGEGVYTKNGKPDEESAQGLELAARHVMSIVNILVPHTAQRVKEEVQRRYEESRARVAEAAINRMMHL